MLTYAKIERPLTPHDLETAVTAPKAPTIKRLRERHFRLAHLLAQGIKDKEAALLCDIHPQYVTVLRKDPLFQQALRTSREQLQEHAMTAADRLSELNSMAIEELIQQLENAEPGDFDREELMSIVKMASDRTGLSPNSSGTTAGGITINIAERMEAAQNRLNPRTIDITPKGENQ